jgi:predicted RNA binding protein YcfA (HicA-like mRNA interferase family)
MSKNKKLLLKIFTGKADNNIGFNELCQLLYSIGFKERIKGSHHIFTKENITEQINLQRDGSKAKAYQVRQVRSLLWKYKLGDLK